METYQVLGIIGSLLLIVAVFIPFAFAYRVGMMGYMGYMGYRAPYFYFFPIFFILPALVLGIIGSIVADRLVAGILLILAALFSLPIMFGFFGISFILLLIAGILALTRR
jgi:hypothetical protein